MSDTFDKTLDRERLDKIRRVMPAFLDALGLEQKRAYNAGVSMELLPAVDEDSSRPRYLTAELPDGEDGTPRELHVLAYIVNPYESSMGCATAYVRCAAHKSDMLIAMARGVVCAGGVAVGELNEHGITFNRKEAKFATYNPADLRALADWLEKRMERGQA